MEKKIGQLFIVGLNGTELSTEEAKFLVDNNIGGVCLFTRNIESPQQLHKLCGDLQRLKHKMPNRDPLIISIDMEGGRVHRLKAPFTQWPSLRSLGDLDSTSIAFQFSLKMGMELSAMGINLNFAPCVDPLTNPENKVIGDRSFGEDPEKVSRLVSAVVRGYIKANVFPCAKHFPGHGETVIDSHDELPSQDTSLELLRSREFVAFKKAFRARIDFVMTAHIKFPNIDPDWPTTLSPLFLRNIIRDELKYRNLIITDDLDMKALRNNYSIEEIAVQSLKAGANILLYCNEPDSPKIALEAVRKAVKDGHVTKEDIDFSYDKIIKLKKDKIFSVEPMPFEEASRIIGHPDHLRLSKSIREGQIPEDLKST